MEIVDSREAQSQLSEWIRRVLQGERIVIAEAGKPLVELQPYRPMPREGGTWKGQVRMDDDFDEPLPDLEQEIYGEDPT